MTTKSEEGRVLPKDWREALLRIRVQLVVLILLCAFYGIAALGVLPTNEQLYSSAAGFFKKYGVLVVAPISFTENLVGLNVYFPGSVAILTSMAITAGDLHRAINTFFAIVLPAFLAHQINYFIGRYMARGGVRGGGRYGSPVARHFIFMGALWHPHFAALACIDAGAQGMRYSRFMSSFAPWFIAWNAFWGLLMYRLGGVIIQESQGSPVMLAFLLLWLIWDLFNLSLATRLVGARIVKKFRLNY